MSQNPFSLFVMGSQRRGFISEVFLGSVSHNIIRKAPVPVLFWCRPSDNEQVAENRYDFSRAWPFFANRII